MQLRVPVRRVKRARRVLHRLGVDVWGVPVLQCAHARVRPPAPAVPCPGRQLRDERARGKRRRGRHSLPAARRRVAPQRRSRRRRWTHGKEEEDGRQRRKEKERPASKKPRNRASLPSIPSTVTVAPPLYHSHGKRRAGYTPKRAARFRPCGQKAGLPKMKRRTRQRMRMRGSARLGLVSKLVTSA